jgi:hypothetical protein
LKKETSFRGGKATDAGSLETESTEKSQQVDSGEGHEAP